MNSDASIPNFYIIAGCNGAGKTTASETILPEILHCREFVNADNIAKGLSPFNVEKVAFEAGRIMLLRIHELLDSREDFAVETTLSSHHYVGLIAKAQALGYRVSLLFVWLEDVALAKNRVAERVRKGGHNIPPPVIERRYYRGVHHLVHQYRKLVDYWIVINNSYLLFEEIANGKKNKRATIANPYLWNQIKRTAYAGTEKKSISNRPRRSN